MTHNRLWLAGEQYLVWLKIQFQSCIHPAIKIWPDTRTLPFFLSSGLPFFTVATIISPEPAAGNRFRRPFTPCTAITYKFLAPETWKVNCGNTYAKPFSNASYTHLNPFQYFMFQITSIQQNHEILRTAFRTKNDVLGILAMFPP
jgi:hypothetical protein